MGIARYLLYMSYIGKPFMGCQTLVNRKLINKEDPNTVQGQIEMALKILNPKNRPLARISSRTDSGVHALSTTMDVELERYSEEMYQPNTVTLALNKHFSKKEIPIRIIKTYIVPNDFHSGKNAIGRTYLYRFAVIKNDLLNATSHLHHIPVEELERCYFICSDTFDIEAMRDSAKLFLGLHDFRTFMHKSSKDPDKITRKVIGRMEILEGKPAVYSSFSWPREATLESDFYKFYEIYLQANGFLHKQVSTF